MEENEIISNTVYKENKEKWNLETKITIRRVESILYVFSEEKLSFFGIKSIG